MIYSLASQPTTSPSELIKPPISSSRSSSSDRSASTLAARHSDCSPKCEHDILEPSEGGNPSWAETYVYRTVSKSSAHSKKKPLALTCSLCAFPQICVCISVPQCPRHIFGIYTVSFHFAFQENFTFAKFFTTETQENIREKSCYVDILQLCI